MAVTPTTLTELSDLAKDFFTNVWANQTNPETALKAQFASLENANFTGKLWIFGIKSFIGGASSNAGANKTLPPADEGQYDQGQANVVRTYTRMALDGLAIEVTRRQQGSYRPALAETMSDRLQAHDLEVNRQMFCAGDGKLADVLTDSGTDQVMTLDYSVTNGGAGARHLYAGDKVAFYNAAGSTLRNRRVITAVNYDTNTITVDSDPVTTAGDFVTRSTDDDDNLTAGEAAGLLQSVEASATFETIPITSNWKSVVMANSGTLRDVSDSLVMQMIESIRSRSRQVPNLIVTTPGIVLKYSELFLPLRRIDGQDVQLKGGYKPIAAVIHAGGAIPVLGDIDCPGSRMFFLNTSAFRMADVVGTEWADMDGATFDRVVDKDAIEGYIRKYWQLITIQRNANGVIEDLNDVTSLNRHA
jgi:hypothetical protein